MTKSRNDLKGLFVKNAIPKENDFADLIDSQLNQQDDGIYKLKDNPLSIVAALDPQKRALCLYAESTATSPDWMISLKPAEDPTNPTTTNRLGLGFTNGAGNTRLFIEAGAAGKVGIGTVKPTEKLQVMGRVSCNDMITVGPEPWDGGSKRGNLCWGPWGTDKQDALVLSTYTNTGGPERFQEVGVYASKFFLAGGLNVSFTPQTASFGGGVVVAGVGVPAPTPLSTLTVGGSNASLRITSGNDNGYVFENDNVDDYKLKLRYRNPTAVFSEIMIFDYHGAVEIPGKLKAASASFGGSTQVIVNDRGNVGIGTTTPAYPLDVMGAAVIVGTVAGGGRFHVRRAGDGAEAGTFGFVGTSQVLEMNSQGGGGELSFSTNAAERMRIDRTGNVEIHGNLKAASASIAQEEWRSPTLLNGWTWWPDPAYGNIGYFKDSNGMVHLRGLLKGGTSGRPAFQLPEGYRPENIQLFVVGANDTASRLDLAPDGNVSPTVSPSWISLFGISFRAYR